MGLLEISLVLVMVSLFVPMCVCMFAREVKPWTGVASMLAGTLFWGCHIAIESWTKGDGWSWYLAVPAEIQGLLASFGVAVLVQTWGEATGQRTE
jgi:hypothetical protein